MDPAGTSKRPGFGAHGGLKDTGSTDIIVHSRNRLCHAVPMRRSVDARSRSRSPAVARRRGCRWTASLPTPRWTSRTGELMFFNYSKYAPFMHYGGW